jgi:NAD(P)-dependent dehydrogenase (short-subunit alcohol dehydrogenase family)
MASMKRKVIAITGGASGIGLATAKLLAARGAKVSIADVQDSVLQEATSAIKSDGNPDVMTSVVDVRNTESVKAWIKDTVNKFGTLDGAANVAGVFKSFPNGTVESEDEQNWEFMLGVNLTGVMHCLRAQLPLLKEDGSIVNAARILGLQGAAGHSAYASSKHGVIGLTRCVAKEVGGRGVRVNCIAP